MVELLRDLKGIQFTSIGIKARFIDQDPSMATKKIDLEKLNGKNDLNMQKVKMEALLVTEGLRDAIQSVTKKESKEVSSS